MSDRANPYDADDERQEGGPHMMELAIEAILWFLRGFVPGMILGYLISNGLLG